MQSADYISQHEIALISTRSPGLYDNDTKTAKQEKKRRIFTSIEIKQVGPVEKFCP